MGLEDSRFYNISGASLWGVIRSGDFDTILVTCTEPIYLVLPFFGGESPYIVDATLTSGTSEASDQSECNPLE
jgi:hypothetical protein